MSSRERWKSFTGLFPSGSKPVRALTSGDLPGGLDDRVRSVVGTPSPAGQRSGRTHENDRFGRQGHPHRCHLLASSPLSAPPSERAHAQIPAEAGRSEGGLGNNPVRTNTTSAFRFFPNRAVVICVTLEQSITAAVSRPLVTSTPQVGRNFLPPGKMDRFHPLNGVPGVRQSAGSTPGPNRGS